MKQYDRYAPFLEKLKQLYAEMDKKYDQAAAYYGFRCTGCEDNCCRTQFFHYTCAEFLCLAEGVSGLSAQKRMKIEERASRILKQEHPDQGEYPGKPPLCPLNFGGRCALYAHRPMICRLHGIPHEIHWPGMPVSHGTGCDLFEQKFGSKKYVPFDRTPFYRQLAALETELRGELGGSKKIKYSIAQMLGSPLLKLSDCGDYGQDGEHAKKKISIK